MKMEGFHFISNTFELTGFRCKLKSITNGKRKWRDLKRTDREKIRKAVVEHTSDMLTLFLTHIEGDIQAFMLSDPLLSEIN
jgi:hypothetical protein